jgi:hypothetical protein
MRGIHGGHPAGHHKRHDQPRQTVLAHTVTVAPTPDSARDIGRKRADVASLADQENLLGPATLGTPAEIAVGLRTTTRVSISASFSH